MFVSPTSRAVLSRRGSAISCCLRRRAVHCSAAYSVGGGKMGKDGDERIRAADVFIRALENENVKFVFGLPGEENLDVLDALRTSSIRLVVCRHEQAAGFMAATLGRLTGKVSVCLSTLGPGATNLTTAAAYAQLCGYPMLMVTGQKPIRESKQGSFQIIDVVDMMNPLTKLSKQVSEGALLAALTRKVVKIAEEEKPGPVHLELPEDIAKEEVPLELFPVYPVRRPVAEDKAIHNALKLVRESRSPLLCIGAGANRKLTATQLRQFVDDIGIPFITTQMGKGVVDERHRLYIGCAALSANDFVHCAAEASDLILNIGHDTVEKPPFIMHRDGRVRVIHINFTPSEIDAVYSPQVDIVGDISNTIWRLRAELQAPCKHWDFSYFHTVKAYQQAHLLPPEYLDKFPLTPQRVVADVRAAMPEHGVVTLDNGMYKVWFARAYPTYHRNTLLLDNALATMGAGLPSAIAVALQSPGSKVMAVCGDGGFAMNCQELATAVENKLNLTVVILNDKQYGMIVWKQHNEGRVKWGLDISNPNFCLLAKSFGANGHQVESLNELQPLLRKCLDSEGVHLVDVPVDYTLSTEQLGDVLKEQVAELRELQDKPREENIKIAHEKEERARQQQGVPSH